MDCSKEQRCTMSLSIDQIEQYHNDGILVVPNVLTNDEISKSLEGLYETLKYRYNVQSKLVNDSKESARNFQKLSSTNGSGGVLDIFYEEWKINIISSNINLFYMTKQLWKSMYCSASGSASGSDSNNDNNNNNEHSTTTSNNDNDDDDEHSSEHKQDNNNNEISYHPYSNFDCNKGYMYIDRIGYRLPTKISNEMGEIINKESKPKKARSLQRSLTPHLDCCPETFYDDISTETTKSKSKWRPIQCFISLTDNLNANTGGFEAVKGFHKEFYNWSKRRPPSTIINIQKDKNKTGKKIEKTSIIKPPCIGEYTHIRPKEDHDIMDRICHIQGVSAGSAVFWDNRIPHSNSYKHNGTEPRIVVYCSFLPDVNINRQYVKNQLLNMKLGKSPTDQWNNISNNESNNNDNNSSVNNEVKRNNEILTKLTPLGRKLIGIEPWHNNDDF